MAFKTILIVSFFVAVQADYDRQNNGRPAGFPRFRPFPAPPFIPLPGFNIPFPAIQIPSVEDMKNINPGPNSQYSGVAVRSSSKVEIGEDGKPKKTGGTTVFFNNNGEKEEIKRGNNPPNLDDPIVFPPMPVIVPLAMPPMRPFKTMKPVNVPDYENGMNQHYVGASVSAYSHSSNINGVKTSGGGINKATNVDGDIDVEHIQFGQHDLPVE